MFRIALLLLATIDIGTIFIACTRMGLFNVTPTFDEQTDMLPPTVETITNQGVQEAPVSAEQYRKKPRPERHGPYGTMNSLDFTRRYLSYEEMHKYLNYVRQKRPDMVKLSLIGNSYEKRPLTAVTISSKNPSKTILIDAGIHAREWIAPATALYVIDRLVRHANESRDLLSNLTWIILPLVNPDGYEYSLKVDKYWRKTRRPHRRCHGTDINRNFGFHWGEKGASRNECVPTFAGPEAFSEPETRALRNFLLSKNSSIDFYLSLHSYGRFLLYPWGFKKDLSRRWKLMDAVARAGSVAMKLKHNANYRVGGAANLLYEASGGSDDYALAVARIPIVITMELPGDKNGFHPTQANIAPFLEEAFTGIRAMAIEALQPKV
ncbi:carboxypeptidase B-like [Toxorhynchites rutilus septentrionalis]|uniref:carboxypeptidase B-like n=1 Tax=Toxorhynchites rutilus septentrionalis TaxID=329112 RepID=UPI00247AF802|nr:carboxypeptidase B-like [Toxorhynchites rutilus septentrionalis]